MQTAGPYGVRVKKNLYFSQKKHFSERGPHWSNKTLILVKKTFIGVYRELACPAQVELASSAGGIGQKKHLF